MTSISTVLIKPIEDSLMKLEFLVICLTTEVINFIKRYPHTNPAGLMLNIDVLLTVYEEVDESVFMEPGDDIHGAIDEALFR